MSAGWTRPHCRDLLGGFAPKEEARKDHGRRGEEPGPFSITRGSHHPSGTAVSQAAHDLSHHPERLFPGTAVKVYCGCGTESKLKITHQHHPIQQRHRLKSSGCFTAIPGRLLYYTPGKSFSDKQKLPLVFKKGERNNFIRAAGISMLLLTAHLSHHGRRRNSSHFIYLF